MRVDLPGGEWAELADPLTVSERKRRRIVELSAALPRDAFGEDAEVTTEVMETLNALTDAGIVALVVSWSYPNAPTLDTLLDLPGPVYDALRVATAPLVPRLMPDFGPTPETDSPTVPSGV